MKNDPRVHIPGIMDPLPYCGPVDAPCAPLAPEAPVPAPVVWIVPEESFRPLGADFLGALGGNS